MSSKKRLQLSALCFCLFAFPLVAMPEIYHVNINSGNDANNGLSWSSAFKNLQAALDVAKEGDDIWIAAGVYYPTKKIAEVYGSNSSYKATPTGDRHRSFVIPKNVSLYGGFQRNPSNSASMSSRNWKVNQTVLSGDFDNNDGDNFENMDENAFHVVILFDATPATVIDGFFITGGCANDVANVYMDEKGRYYVTSGDGGGIYAYSPLEDSSPAITNVSFYGNYARVSGGGMFNFSFAENAAPKITNASFIHNKAETRHGGGLYNYGGYVQAYLSNVNVVGNESFQHGGGLYFCSIDECAPTIVNAVVNGNYTKSGNGGGVCISTNYGDAEPTIINSTICGNKAAPTDRMTGGGGLVVIPEGISKANIMNTVIWGNKANYHDNFYSFGSWGIMNTITGSLIEGLNDLGTTNLAGNTNPLFLDPVNADFAPTLDGDYQLTLTSPLINKGINASVTNSVDLLGNNRIFDGIVDIGAYESQGKTPVNVETPFSEKTFWSYGGNLYVRIDNPTTLRVYAMDGALVKHINNLGAGTYEFTLPQGIYIVTLSNGISEKIIIR